MADVLVPLRAHLVSEGIVREPRVAGDEPPLWLEPRYGVPAPGELPPDSQETVQVGPDAVLGAWMSSGVPPQPYNAGRRIDFVDIRMRTRFAPTGRSIEEEIRAALLDRRDWQMSTLTVIETLLYRELQLVASDKQGFEWVVSYSFETYSGLP